VDKEYRDVYAKDEVAGPLIDHIDPFVVPEEE
jgi:hypothetical protein